MTSVRLEPMSADRFAAWSGHSVEGFAAQQVAAGTAGPAEAAAAARAAFADLLPHGRETPQHHFWTVLAGEEQVGDLWIRVQPLPAEVEAYVYDVEVRPGHRGRGLGRATMLAAETAARDLGADVLRLNVFGHNVAAGALYDSLGYTASSTLLARPADLPLPEPAGPRVELRPMTWEQHDAFRLRVERDRADAAADVGRLLPEGIATPGHLLWTAYDGAGGGEVAQLWLQLRPRPDGLQAFVLDLFVPPALRGLGWGRAVALAALVAGRDLGASEVAVSLLGTDAAARALADGLGFRVAARTMVKRLTRPA